MHTLISNVVGIPDSSTWKKIKRVNTQIFSFPNVQSWQLFLFCRVSAPFELGTTTGNWNEKEKNKKIGCNEGQSNLHLMVFQNTIPWPNECWTVWWCECWSFGFQYFEEPMYQLTEWALFLLRPSASLQIQKAEKSIVLLTALQ